MHLFYFIKNNTRLWFLLGALICVAFCSSQNVGGKYNIIWSKSCVYRIRFCEDIRYFSIELFENVRVDRC